MIRVRPEDWLGDLEATLLADGDEEDLNGAPAGPGGPASISVRVPGGIIRFFFADSRFEAVCSNGNHLTAAGSECRLTRTAHASDTEPACGRPLGLLVAWLSQAFDKATRDEHRCPFNICSISLRDRQDGRRVLEGSPAGLRMLEQERERRDGEPEEPADVPMGW